MFCYILSFVITEGTQHTLLATVLSRPIMWLDNTWEFLCVQLHWLQECSCVSAWLLRRSLQPDKTCLLKEDAPLWITPFCCNLPWVASCLHPDTMQEAARRCAWRPPEQVLNLYLKFLFFFYHKPWMANFNTNYFS